MKVGEMLGEYFKIYLLNTLLLFFLEYCEILHRLFLEICSAFLY